MKVCILCGAPPNINDGVGDFSWLLAQELGKGNTVSLIVPGGDGEEQYADYGSVAVYRVNKAWGIQASIEVCRIVRRVNPQIILVHFVPQLYGWNGAKPLFALLLLALKRREYRIVTVAHEFSAPFGPSPKLIVVAFVHRLLLWLIKRASRRIVVTTRFALSLFKRRFPTRQGDFLQIPISSTIPVVPVDKTRKEDLRRELRIAPEEFVIATFGSVVGSAATLLEELLSWFIHEVKRSRILILGKAGEEVRRKLAQNRVILDRTVTTGPLSSEAVSEHLSISDLLVVFYPDGCSTRRTSLMVGLAHGVPTVSNIGVLTDASLKASGAMYLINCHMTEEQAMALRQLCRDARLRADLGKQGKAFFEEHLSWKEIGRQYVLLLQEALTA